MSFSQILRLSRSKGDVSRRAQDRNCVKLISVLKSISG